MNACLQVLRVKFHCRLLFPVLFAALYQSLEAQTDRWWQQLRFVGQAIEGINSLFGLEGQLLKLGDLITQLLQFVHAFCGLRQIVFISSDRLRGRASCSHASLPHHAAAPLPTVVPAS